MNGKRALDELDDDIRAHIEAETRDNIERGMTPEDARRRALIAFGNVALAKEDTQAVWSWPWLDEVRQDLRYALRTLGRNPGFAMVAVLTLALGIAATTAIYSVVDAILLQPLPYPDSDRLVRVFENVPIMRFGSGTRWSGFNRQEFLEWRARTRALSTTGGLSPAQALVKTREGTARLWGGTASGDFFALLGTRPLLGRTLVPADEAAPNVVLLSFDTWRRFLRADPNAVGSTLEFQSADQQGRLMEVVGVLPADFAFPTEGMDFYVPFAPDDFSSRYRSVLLLGRLGPGVTPDHAQQEAEAIGAAVMSPPQADAPVMTVPRFEVQGLKDRAVKELRPALRVFLAAVAVVLLVVCANVANLLLARGLARQREMAVRFALGAGRGRVMRQVLTECLVLALLGGILGAGLGALGIVLVKGLASVEAPGIFRFAFDASVLPRVNEIGIQAKTIAFAFGIAAAASLLFGALPALHLSRPNPIHAMGPRGGGASRGTARLGSALVVGQLVLATVLLVGAGLLIHSFGKLSALDRGYDASHAVSFQLVFPPSYSVARKVETIETLLTRLRAVPDVEAAGFTRAGMLIGEQITVGEFVPPGRTREEMAAFTDWPRLRPVSPGFLTAMGVPVIEGRELTGADFDDPVAAIVLTRSVARRFFGEGASLGQVVDWHPEEGFVFRLQVVGVVEDVRNGSHDDEPYPEIFMDYRRLLAFQQQWGAKPLWQNETSLGLVSFAVRTKGDPAPAVPSIGRIIRAVDPLAGIDAILPMERLVASSVARPRFFAVLLGAFAAVAALLAAIGIYGVLAYSVTQRTREIGVRMALGAQRAQVMALVLGKGAALAAIGIVLGLGAAALGTRFLQGMLFGVTPLDPKTFVAVSLAFGLVAILASYVPARRATKVDPMVALRVE